MGGQNYHDNHYHCLGYGGKEVSLEVSVAPQKADPKEK